MGTAVTWVRTQRTSGAGPWHAEAPEHTGQTWCGARLHKRTLNLEYVADPSAESDRLCDACLRALGEGKPRPWRRRA